MKIKALLTAFLVVACCASAKAENLAQFWLTAVEDRIFQIHEDVSYG